MPLTSATRLGPYEITGPLGSGGMGEVYRARDLRLDRDVAIKVLPEHLANNPDFRARFLREAKAVAALSHPNILTIHDFGLENQVCYAVTELLEGETLREALSRSVLPWRRALEYGVLIAEGLSAAHAKGIIHRDLKPENIFVTADGQLKILDFGLARFESAASTPGANDPTLIIPAAAAGQTGAGTVMGTLGYMAPEQVRGDKVQATADIFALGCVLYEMLSCKPAFAHPALNVSFAARGSAIALSVESLERAVPPAAAHLVERCLEKKAEARYQSARDLAFQLREILSSSEIRKEGGGIPSVAVLPFVSARPDADSDYLCDGVTESIINNLSSIPKLRVAARSLVFRYKGKDVDCLAAARDLHVDAILSGRLVQRGDHLQIQADLMDAARGSQLWGQKFSRKMAGIFEVEEEIGREIADALRVQLTGKEVEQLAKHYTQSAAAYQCYLKGRHYWARRSAEGLRKSIEEFSQAIALDSNYALAYCGLADTYGMLSMYRFAPPQEVAPQALAAARKAVEIDANLAEAHTSWAFWTMNYEWSWVKSEIAFRRALELNPRFSTAHQWYSAHLLCRGRFEEALASAKTAVLLDPLSLSANSSLGWVLHFSRRYDEAIHQYRKTIEIDPSFFLTFHFLALSYEQKGMYEEAIEACQQVAKMPGGLEVVTGSLVHTYGKSGRPDKARKFLAELMRRRQTSYVPAHDLAMIHVGLNDTEQALAWLAEACNERSSWITLMRVDPRLDGLRGDTRFQALLRRVGLD